MKKILQIKLLFSVFLWIFGLSIAYGQIVNPSSYEKLRHETTMAVTNKVNPLLNKYCDQNCQLIDIDLEIEEAISDGDDLGFESVSEDDAKNIFYIKKAVIKLQVDERVTGNDRDRLKNVLDNHLASLGFPTTVSWVAVQLPRIGQLDATVSNAKKHLEKNLTKTISTIINKYCPEDCVLSDIGIDGYLITPEQSNSFKNSEIVRVPSSDTIMKVDQVTVDMEFNESLNASERSKILNVMRAKTKYISPVEFNENVSSFPETFVQKERNERNEADDPYGLEKLRRMLVMFRDLAGTKEVLTTNTNTMASKDMQTTNNSSLNNVKESLSNSSLTSETSSLQGEKDKTWIDGVPNWVVVLAGIFFIFMVVAALLTRFLNAKRDADYMIHAMGNQGGDKREGTNGSGDMQLNIKRSDSGGFESGDIALKLSVEDLKQELVGIFIKAPKVAKETFARMLHEEGVEQAAKYVHIFGHMIVFELLGDPNLSRDLYELSEFYHKSNFNFTLEDEKSLLMSLRTKVTANEIKVLTRKTMDQFDFILKLDANQLFNLIADEKPTVQSIVLTQLDHKRRRGVFDFFEGQNKVNLMRELCQADAIPKDYLSNVAKALHKKVISRPEYDAENLRSADILLELLEKSSVSEQKALMSNLQETNSDAARAIKLKLVTIEMLPYLKTGHLLEIVLGLSTQDMVTFLAGTKDHIRQLLLSHAPEDLAESWIEELDNVNSVDDDRYQLVEMKILGRIRNLASNGAINILDINDLIFAKNESEEIEEQTNSQMNVSHLVA